MEEKDYTLAELSPEEGKKLSEEITAVLEKYNAEIGVKSILEILKRVPKTEEPTPSPFILNEGENPTKAD